MKERESKREGERQRDREGEREKEKENEIKLIFKLSAYTSKECKNIKREKKLQQAV